MNRPFLVPFTLALACGGTAANFPEPAVSPPSAPSQNSTEYQVSGLRNWSLIGNDLDLGHDRLEVSVQPPPGTDFVDFWVGTLPGHRMQKDGDGHFRAELDLSSFGPGEVQVLFAANGNPEAFWSQKLLRSHPLYVVVSTDWDDADTSDEALSLQDELHAEHPELLLTHFVGPYTFTDPTLTQARREVHKAWLTGMRDTYDDEIGLHIHPYCNFVDQIDEILGVEPIECNTDASTVYANDSTGYTIQCAAYSAEEFTNQLLAADELFKQNGLGKPTSFRAGGWTADLSTMQALENAGYVADTSANNWARMEEWDAPFRGTLYSWNRTNWSTINDTSQPYYPSKADIQATADNNFTVLEVPDNGSLVDYVSGQEMIDIFQANWPGGPLQAPTNYSIGYHPSNFNRQYKDRMSEALGHVDMFLASEDKGPVVYARLSDMALVWKAQ